MTSAHCFKSSGCKLSTPADLPSISLYNTVFTSSKPIDSLLMSSWKNGDSARVDTEFLGSRKFSTSLKHSFYLLSMSSFFVGSWPAFHSIAGAGFLKSLPNFLLQFQLSALLQFQHDFGLF